MRATWTSRNVVPCLLVVGLLGIVATLAAAYLVTRSLEDQLREELAGAGLSANQAMVRLEASSLAVLRQMTFTVGLDDAIAAQDPAALQRLLVPIAANARLPYVDVFRADGAPLLALRAPELGADAAQWVDPAAAAWPPVSAALSGAADTQGDKYADRGQRRPGRGAARGGGRPGGGGDGGAARHSPPASAAGRRE
jgi:hypothetical protein